MKIINLLFRVVKIIVMSCIFSVSIAGIAMAGKWPAEVISADGRVILLFKNGTWQYKTNAISNAGNNTVRKTRPADSSVVLKSKKGFFELWYDPGSWVVQKASRDSDAEYNLKHVNGDGYALVIVERIGMTLKALQEIALNNARNAAPDAKIVYEKKVNINGTEMLIMDIAGTIKGISFRYHGAYWTGDSGSIQVITYTGKNLFKEYQNDFSKLLYGVVIRK